MIHLTHSVNKGNYESSKLSLVFGDISKHGKIFYSVCAKISIFSFCFLVLDASASRDMSLSLEFAVKPYISVLNELKTIFDGTLLYLKSLKTMET